MKNTNLKHVLIITIIFLLISTPAFATSYLASETKMAGTSISSWKNGVITIVTITRNDTKYKDSYLTNLITKDSFAATFSIYGDGNLFSPYPESVRVLYGSASPIDAYTSGSKTFVTYAYMSNAGDYEAEVVVNYNIK